MNTLPNIHDLQLPNYTVITRRAYLLILSWGLFVLCRDTLSHNHLIGSGVGPTNPRVISVELHTRLIKFSLFQNYMVLERLPTKYYMQVQNLLF